MAEIQLVRMPGVELSEADRLVMRRGIFEHIDGIGESNQKSWRRWWNRVLRLEPGEVMEVRTHQERLGWYHRKHMALEQAVFQAQERFDVFKGFRDWIKVGAGHCDWYPGPKGGVFPVPKTISYSKLEQADMERFHDEAVAFLRTAHAGKTLWPHLTPAARIDMIEVILRGFNE
ncbi:DUF1367 family protein [Lampropedia aestuarii]|uniref:DUF1367 family protein n=1 Tax=Lampropedia aestuarii TaxID=2562762 RepID=A0A4S5BRP7_9BURK|nr:DUF1367 family protein [Lampropedia aestuarii]THJ32396.1 DUF1367 family protein [Lampropedia aestuarii]